MATHLHINVLIVPCCSSLFIKPASRADLGRVVRDARLGYGAGGHEPTTGKLYVDQGLKGYLFILKE